MKKIIAIITLLTMVNPCFALSAEEGKARVKVGPFKARITNNKETKKTTQTFSITRSGANVTISAGVARTDLSTFGVAIGVALVFDSLPEVLEAGQTYELTNSNDSELNIANTFILAVRATRRGSKGVTTLTEANTDGDITNNSVATGQMLVKEYNAETGEIVADISVDVTPYGKIKKNGQTKAISNKPLKIKIAADTTIQ